MREKSFTLSAVQALTAQHIPFLDARKDVRATYSFLYTCIGFYVSKYVCMSSPCRRWPLLPSLSLHLALPPPHLHHSDPWTLHRLPVSKTKDTYKKTLLFIDGICNECKNTSYRLGQCKQEHVCIHVWKVLLHVH